MFEKALKRVKIQCDVTKRFTRKFRKGYRLGLERVTLETTTSWKCASTKPSCFGRRETQNNHRVWTAVRATSPVPLLVSKTPCTCTSSSSIRTTYVWAVYPCATAPTGSWPDLVERETGYERRYNTITIGCEVPTTKVSHGRVTRRRHRDHCYRRHCRASEW